MRASQEQNRDSTSPQAFAPGGFFRLAEGDFHRRIAASSGVVVVLFSTPHCSACRAWKQLLPQALAGLVSTFFEVDVSESTGVARYFDIFHLPTIYLYRNGQFHAELQCEARRETIQETTHHLVAMPAQEEP